MLRTMRIASRSVLFFGALGAITLILGLFALAQLNKLGDIADEVSGLRLPQVIITGELRRDFISSRLYAANFALAANKAQQEAATFCQQAHFRPPASIELVVALGPLAAQVMGMTGKMEQWRGHVL